MCTKWIQELTLEWSIPSATATIGTTRNESSLNPEENNLVTFTFTQNGTNVDPALTGFFELAEIKAVIHTNPIDFPNAADPGRLYFILA
jgi:hypothetical protein